VLVFGAEVDVVLVGGAGVEIVDGDRVRVDVTYEVYVDEAQVLDGVVGWDMVLVVEVG
jgi:hypothetical protein